MNLERPQTVKPLPLPEQTQSRQVDFIIREDGVIEIEPEEFEDLNTNLTGYLEWIKEARRQLEYYVEGLSSDADPE